MITHHLVLASLICVVLQLQGGCGCHSSPQPDVDYQARGTITQRNSQDWGTLNRGELVVTNNVWNKNHAASGESLQEIFLEEINGEKAFGWRWKWPNSADVVSYPEVVFGIKPWNTGNHPYPAGQSLPCRAGSKTLSASFDIQARTSGQCNMAFSLWAVTDLNAPQQSISHEIMIWIDNHGSTPAGMHQGSLSVNETTFEVYVNPHQTDNSGGATITWTYIAFVAQRPVLKGTLDLAAFLAYLLNQGIMTTDHYVTSVELGNEIVGGTGLVEISNFAVTVH